MLKGKYIIQLFDEAPINDWVDTNWTNTYLVDHRTKYNLTLDEVRKLEPHYPVTKNIAKKALRYARAHFDFASYMIVKVKNSA